MDRVLVLMPKKTDEFLFATTVIQDYAMQMRRQLLSRTRVEEAAVTIALANGEHFFLSSLFPRMQVTMAEEVSLQRSEWECVIDMRDMWRVFSMAEPSRKHMVAVWGTIVGSSPVRLVPELGYLGMRAAETDGFVDLLIDEAVPEAEELVRLLALNYPELNVRVAAVGSLRVSEQFRMLAAVGTYIGRASGTTALAATMGKGVLELYGSGEPVWWMAKGEPPQVFVVADEVFSAVRLWPFVEDLCTSLLSMNSLEGTLTVEPQSIAANVGGK